MTLTDQNLDYRPMYDRLGETFRSGRTRDLDWRLEQLKALDAMLTDHEADFLDALRADLGRPPFEGFAADLWYTKKEIGHAIKHLRRWAAPKKVSTPLALRPGRSRIVAEPLGVVLVIGPWNYPIGLLITPLVGAIAAGNAVVAKPSEHAPASSAAIAEHARNYLDEAAIAVVEGGVPESTALLDLNWDKIFFTGGTEIGKVVMAAAARHLTPVTLELGGKSPAIVAADADLAVAARRIAFGKNMNAGQTCVAPDYVLVEDSVRDEFVRELDAAFADFHGVDFRSSPDLSRIVDDRHHRRLVELVERSGGTVVTGGQSDATERFIAPTVIVDPDPDADVMREEIFGPVLPVVTVRGVAGAIDFVNRRPKPLALYVFSSSQATVDGVVRSTSSGGVCVNQTISHIATPHLPFGGVGPSGMGSYHGRASFDAFSHDKSVLYKPEKPDSKLFYPPYTKVKQALLRRFM